MKYSTNRKEREMNISKIGAVWNFLTGGWSGLAVYVLECVNRWLATLDAEKLAQAALVVKSLCNAVDAFVPLIPLKYAAACKATTNALATLALALADGQLTKEELDVQIDAVEAAIEAWRHV